MLASSDIFQGSPLATSVAKLRALVPGSLPMSVAAERCRSNDRLKVTVLGEGMMFCVLHEKPGRSDVFDGWVLIEVQFPGGRFHQNLHSKLRGE
jgi:hypothetical protein